jgi:Cellulase (glycosyl hydrolase family 5)
MHSKTVVLHLCASIASMSMIGLFAHEGTSILGVTTNQVHTTGASREAPFQGVNMDGYYTTVAELRDYGKPPPLNYYNDSFRIFSEAGLSSVRYLFTWESYEKNPGLFINELLNVSKTADKWGLKLVYANDQFHISSWLDPKSGYGFPSYLFTPNKNRYPFGGGGSSDTEVARSWWTDWYNQTIRDAYGHDGWTMQADFLKKVVAVVDRHESTLGYEILNEPAVFSVDQWDKIGSYNTFIASKLRQITNKTIFFDRQLPDDIGGTIEALPENMAKMVPRNISNIVFKSTLYGLPTHCSYAEARLTTAARAAQLMKVPLWMGEFNIGITPKNPISDINQTEFNLFIDKFREVKAWGWSFWLWSFNHLPENVKNYNLAFVSTDSNSGSETIQPTKYFEYLKKNAGISSQLTNGGTSQEESNLAAKKESNVASIFDKRHDTICPTIVVTRIEGTSKDTDFFIPTSPLEPLQVHVASPNPKLLVQGSAYDVGSELGSIQIKLGGISPKYQPKYQPIALSKANGSSHWSASIDVNSTGSNKLVIRAVDKAGNLSYNTIFLNFTTDNKF